MYSPFKRYVVFIAFIAVVSSANANAEVVIDTPKTIADSSFRGISVVSENEAWVGGSNGTLMHTVDQGKSWKRIQLPGESVQELDFRDIESPSRNVIVVMAAGPALKSRIYRSVDNGKHWDIVLQNKNEKGFFNAIAFWNAKHGLLVGDPLDGRLDLYRTSDSGETWQPLPKTNRPKLKEGEYGFAASGTNLCVAASQHAFVATGGVNARVLMTANHGQTWTERATPITFGKPSTGIFSVAFRDAKHGVIVGGDYKLPDEAKGNVAWTKTAGETWKSVQTATDAKQQASGIRHKACVRFLCDQNWMATGRTGTVSSKDDGHTWRNISGESFYTFDASPEGRSGWFAGADGRVAAFRLK